MKRARSWLFILVAVLAVVLISSSVTLAGPPTPTAPPPPATPRQPNGPQGNFNQPPGASVEAGIQITPLGQMNYQGKLLQNGSPYNGNIAITFRLYKQATGGAAFWEETQTVSVSDGLFNVMLGAVNPMADAQEFYEQVWLGIQPAGASAELTPRQPLGAVGYAMNLLPGATMVDPGLPGYGTSFYVSSHNHPAIYGGSDTNIAITGEAFYTDTSAVAGLSYGAGGQGVYGYAMKNGTGVYGVGVGTGGIFGGGIGVYGEGTNGLFSVGVYGRGDTWGVLGSGFFGVEGSGEITGSIGVYGLSYAPTDGIGVYGRVVHGENDDASAGVWGEVTVGGGVGVRGNKEGTWGVAVKGTNTGDTGSGISGISTNYIGTWGQSTNDWAFYGRTGRADDNYGLYTPDNLWSKNYHLAGAIMHLAQNGGSEPLEPGDVVVFSGMSAPLENGLQVMQVAKATSANSTAVAGVVYSGYNIAVLTAHRQDDGRNSPTFAEITPAGPVAPGDYLLVVVQGPALVKASGPIQPGDLLASAGKAGYAAKAAEVEINGTRIALPGSVFGKALEPLTSGEKMIYIFVTLQ